MRGQDDEEWRDVGEILPGPDEDFAMFLENMGTQKFIDWWRY